MPTMTLRLDEETQLRLDRLAEATERSKAYLAVQALRSFLDANEWQTLATHEAIVQADAASTEDFVDHDHVSAWLETWGSDRESEPPL